MLGPYTLPESFPRHIEAFACDLDRTLIASDVVLRERTKAAIAAARADGIRVVIVTGRMFQSALPYAHEAGIDDPIVCYQGAAVVDPETRKFLSHDPIPLPLARETIAAVEAAGHSLNVYVGDELYVAEVTPEAERYAYFQELEIHPVGNLIDWLDEPPTKLVSVGEAEALDVLRDHMQALFDSRLHISKSLPIFLEFSRKGVTKGSGLAFLARLLGFERVKTVAFGDAENDVEMLEWAGYAVAVENADDRVLALADHVCPTAENEGVAQVIEAYLTGSRP
jgi:Cof subfamily protein (haloacid dehalogenase superfamily)